MANKAPDHRTSANIKRRQRDNCHLNADLQHASEGLLMWDCRGLRDTRPNLTISMPADYTPIEDQGHREDSSTFLLYQVLSSSICQVNCAFCIRQQHDDIAIVKIYTVYFDDTSGARHGQLTGWKLASCLALMKLAECCYIIITYPGV